MKTIYKRLGCSVAIIIFVALPFAPIGRIRGVGSVPVEIRFDSASDSKVKSLEYYLCSERDIKPEYLDAVSIAENAFELKRTASMDGNSVHIDLSCTDDTPTSLLLRYETKMYYYDSIIFKLTYMDDHTHVVVHRWKDLQDRINRSVTLNVP